eukprot:363051-Chlamydomonas_euryale.AAC.5
MPFVPTASPASSTSSSRSSSSASCAAAMPAAKLADGFTQGAPGRGCRRALATSARAHALVMAQLGPVGCRKEGLSTRCHGSRRHSSATPLQQAALQHRPRKSPRRSREYACPDYGPEQAKLISTLGISYATRRALANGTSAQRHSSGRSRHKGPAPALPQALQSRHSAAGLRHRDKRLPVLLKALPEALPGNSTAGSSAQPRHEACPIGQLLARASSRARDQVRACGTLRDRPGSPPAGTGAARGLLRLNRRRRVLLVNSPDQNPAGLGRARRPLSCFGRAGTAHPPVASRCALSRRLFRLRPALEPAATAAARTSGRRARTSTRESWRADPHIQRSGASRRRA